MGDGTLTEAERREAGFFDGPNPLFVEFVAQGWPTGVFRQGPWDGQRLVVLSAHLDRSLWVLPELGSEVLVASHVVAVDPGSAGHRVLAPVNEYGLSARQVEVLLAIVDAARWGLIDEDHAVKSGLAADVVRKLRNTLVDKGLVAAKSGVLSHRSTVRGARAQVWVATRAGCEAVRPSMPAAVLRRRAS